MKIITKRKLSQDKNYQRKSSKDEERQLPTKITIGMEIIIKRKLPTKIIKEWKLSKIVYGKYV